jgi:hypothetical protein
LTTPDTNNAQQYEYERLITKLEGDIRMHIRVEAQLKLHLESIMQKDEQKYKNSEKAMAKAVKMTQHLKL